MNGFRRKIWNFSRPTIVCLLLFFLLSLANSTQLQLSEIQEQHTTVNLLVPENFIVPENVELPNIQLVKVNPAFAEEDYRALMATRQQIRRDLGTDWPADNLTLAENKASLINDFSNFNQRTNFTYHLFDPKNSRLIGCLYISKSGESKYQAAVYYWLVPDVEKSDIHLAIKAEVKKWIETRWSFQAVDYLFE